MCGKWNRIEVIKYSHEGHAHQAHLGGKDVVRQAQTGRKDRSKHHANYTRGKRIFNIWVYEPNLELHG